jgi:hypothetical protein
MQQQNKTRAQRSGSNAGGLTPTLVPIPMSEDIERMGESPDNLKLNVRLLLLVCLCVFACDLCVYKQLFSAWLRCVHAFVFIAACARGCCH